MYFLEKLFPGNTLYYPGCLTKFADPKLENKYKKLLEIENIEFIQLKDKEFCCGSPIKNSGNYNIFKKLIKDNYKSFVDHGVSRIISNCPACVLMLSTEYPKNIPEWKIEVLHTSQIIKKTLDKIKNTGKGRIATYHDPCHLGRELGLYSKPREVIKLAGFKLKEMNLHGKFSFCCGAGAGVRSNYEELSFEIGKDRLSQSSEVGAQFLITNCPMCLHQLQVNAKKSSQKIEVLDLVDLLI